MINSSYSSSLIGSGQSAEMYDVMRCSKKFVIAKFRSVRIYSKHIHVECVVWEKVISYKTMYYHYCFQSRRVKLYILKWPARYCAWNCTNNQPDMRKRMIKHCFWWYNRHEIQKYVINVNKDLIWVGVGKLCWAFCMFSSKARTKPLFEDIGRAFYLF